MSSQFSNIKFFIQIPDIENRGNIELATYEGNTMTLRTKIAIAFGTVLTLLATIGGLSLTGVTGTVRNARQVIAGNGLDGQLAQREVDHLNWANQVNCLLTSAQGTELRVETDEHKCELGKWLYGEQRKQAEGLVPKLIPLLKEIEGPHRRLHESASIIGKTFRQADVELPGFLASREADHLRWVAKVSELFLKKLPALDIETDDHMCKMGKWLYGEEAKQSSAKSPDLAPLIEALKEPHRKLHESAVEIQQVWVPARPEAAIQIYETMTTPALNETAIALSNLRAAAEESLAGLHRANHIYAEQTMPALKAVQGLLQKAREEARKSIMTDTAMLRAAQVTRVEVVVISVIAIMVGVFLAFFIGKGITEALQRISFQMGQGADRVAIAARQVAESSQSIAEGASSQAASLEQTSSSLEVMASMTKQNADHAAQADKLMKAANQVVEKAYASMRELTNSMQEISTANEDTFKIIKTIDEISFQTNLLALNAAVEAARAGEAGLGFAVVAEEVRSLALRAATAAKDTADLIEGTVKKVKDGSQVVAETNDAFRRVATDATKVGDLVGEIAAASNEQAEGIDELNKAIAQIDKVTQQSAANSQEFASVSQEMKLHAESVREVAGELSAFVGERKTGTETEPELEPGSKVGAEHH